MTLTYLHPASVGGRTFLASVAPINTTAPLDSSTSPVITVPMSRIAQFESRSRVIVFKAPGPVSMLKVPGDELYYVGDMTFDLRETGTTAASVTPVSAGVTVLEGPIIQGNLIAVKLGGYDTAPGAENYFTFRYTCANGEQIDRTIKFTLADDRSWVFGKDPDDKRLYAFDFSSDAAFGASALASVGPPVVAGVSVLSVVTIQGNLVIAKVGGLDLADGAENWWRVAATFANSEKIVRAIYFKQEEN